jgi:hypothetical protein
MKVSGPIQPHVNILLRLKKRKRDCPFYGFFLSKRPTTTIATIIAIVAPNIDI